MKNPLFLIALLLICTSCGNQNSKENDSSTESSEVQDVQDESSFIDPSLIAKVEGDYYILQGDGDKNYYQEPCNYLSYNLKISETAEGSGDWNIEYEDDSYEISLIEDKEGDIHVTTKAAPGMESTFLFEQNKNELLWSFAEIGFSELSPMVKVQNLENFEIKPCTDAAEIMSHLPTTWYELVEIDGEQVIYAECESAPSGYDIDENGESIDFRSGSDPDIIVSMSKINNQITILHRSAYNESETPRSILVDLSNRKDFVNFHGEPHVSDQVKDSFPAVDEDCG